MSSSTLEKTSTTTITADTDVDEMILKFSSDMPKMAAPNDTSGGGGDVEQIGGLVDPTMMNQENASNVVVTTAAANSTILTESNQVSSKTKQ